MSKYSNTKVYSKFYTVLSSVSLIPFNKNVVLMKKSQTCYRIFGVCLLSAGLFVVVSLPAVKNSQD